MAMRVLILDRGVDNPHQLGLALALRRISGPCVVGGPRRYPDPAVVGVYPRAGVKGRRARKLADVALGLGAFERLLNNFRPDVIHLQWSGSLPNHYARRGRGGGSAIVFTVHEPTLPRSVAPCQDMLVRLADRLIVFGPTVAARASQRWPDCEEKLRIVPHGNYDHVIHRFERAYARRCLGLPAALPVFAFIGQLRPAKGLDTLIEAFAEYRATALGQLVIAGTVTDQAYMKQIRRRVSAIGLAVRWVVSPDHVPQRDLDLVASAASHIVLPFYTATQSGSVIFGMTHGRCVISTTTGEVPELLDNGRGVVVGPEDSTSLGRALGELAADEPRTDACGEAARAYAVAELGWPRLAAMTENVYREAIDSAERRNRPEMAYSR